MIPMAVVMPFGRFFGASAKQYGRGARITDHQTLLIES